MNPEDKQQLDTGISKEEVEAAKKVVATLLLAKKKFALYPEGHVSIINSVNQFHKQLELYLHNFGDLRFDIEKDKLLCQGEEIYSGPPEEGALPFTFFRDGIRWLEFMEGIDSSELMDFLKIIIQYSTLSDEPEGDIVTAFWEIQLPHIRYEIADFFWGAEQESDIMPTPDLGEKSQETPGENVAFDWSPLPDPLIDQASIVITPEEEEMIREMVDLEEKGDPTEYLNALFDSLLQDMSHDNFEIILEVLEEEFKSSIPRKNFDVAFKILQSLEYVLDMCSTELPWVTPFLEDFVLTVSSSQSIGPLEEVWADMDSGQFDTIRQILLFLQPEAITTLGPILLQNQAPKLRQILEEAITSLAFRDIALLEALFRNADERLMERLLPVLVRLEGERSSIMLMKLVQHTSPHVRREAVKEILQRGTALTKEIFNLIDDKDRPIRSMVLDKMGRTRNMAAEGFLRDYLQQPKVNSMDSDHVIDCFTALGRCGSSRSIPFLRQTLFGKGWMRLFNTSVLREGAAIALSKMEIKESRQVLEKARRSLFPSVRRIAGRVRQEQVS